MAPPTRQNPERNEGNQSNPPQPPPPPEAWQALMTATNANAQILIQLLQDRNQGQGNQGNQGQGNYQQNFATLNQFLANQPKTFSYCVEATDADAWLVDINKHFECSNVRPEDFVKFASFQLKDQAAEWFPQYKDSRGGRVITWDDFRRDFKAHHIPESVVESKREEFRNLKQGNMSVYQYNTQFQKLSRFAKQDIPDEKSMIYQFRRGLKEELQLALVLFEPRKYDEFYNMALKQEAAQLKCEASKKRVRDAVQSSSSSMVAAKQQKFWLPPPPPFRQPYQQKNKGGNGSSHPPNPVYQNESQNQAPRSSAPYHRPLSEVTCNKCQQKGHYANKCFNQRRLPPPPPVRSSSNAVVKHNSKYAKVNMMNAAQAEDSSEVIMGNLSVNDIPAKVLFDTGASLSFISRPFVAKHEFVTENMPIPLKIVSPGKQMTSNVCVPDVSIKMGDYKFLSKPVVLGDSDIDLILGMDWLSKHKAQLECAAREIKLTHSSNDVIIYASRDDTIRLFSLNEMGEMEAISQIPVVCEYQDVFP